MEDARSCLVVGESLVDVVVTGPPGAATEDERPGGSALNTAVALARLGRPTRLLTSYGDDARGRLLAGHLAASGVTVAGDPLVLERTSVARALIGADGGATYDFDVAWRLGAVGDDVLERVGVVHVGSLGPLLEPGSSAVFALLERLGPEVAVTYDLNVRPAITGTGPDVVQRVQRMVSRAHLVKASDEDLIALSLDVEDLLDLGATAVVVTRGADGAEWHTAPAGTATRTSAVSGRVPAPPAGVVDTIGAGDTFAAGLLDALWDRLGRPAGEVASEEWDAALAHAARCAAVTVSRVGADPPWRHELT